MSRKRYRGGQPFWIHPHFFHRQVTNDLVKGRRFFVQEERRFFFYPTFGGYFDIQPCRY
ncbi:MAG: hypothetical protein AAB316_18335 [Bacteroidota bacterium]